MKFELFTYWFLIVTIIRSHGNGDVDSRNVSTSSQACAEVIEGYVKQLIMLSRCKKEAAASKTTHTTIQYFHFCLTCNICNTNTDTSVFNSCCTACTITKLTLF